MTAGGGTSLSGVLAIWERRDFSRSRCSRMIERTRESLYLSRVSVCVERRDSRRSWVPSSPYWRTSVAIVLLFWRWCALRPRVCQGGTQSVIRSDDDHGGPREPCCLSTGQSVMISAAYSRSI